MITPPSIDAIVHTAFDMSGAIDGDRRCCRGALLAAAGGSRKKIVLYTSGVWVLGATGDTPSPSKLHSHRPSPAPRRLAPPATSAWCSTPASIISATAVIRPGNCVYGGRGSSPAAYFDSAEKEGAAKYAVGDGGNRILLIHLEDLARATTAASSSTTPAVHLPTPGTATPCPWPRVGSSSPSAEAGGSGGCHAFHPDRGGASRTLGPFADRPRPRPGGRDGRSRASRLLAGVPSTPSFLGEVEKTYQEWKRWPPPRREASAAGEQGARARGAPPGVLAQAPDRVRVPVAAVGHVDAQAMAGPAPIRMSRSSWSTPYKSSIWNLRPLAPQAVAVDQGGRGAAQVLRRASPPAG